MVMERIDEIELESPDDTINCLGPDIRHLKNRNINLKLFTILLMLNLHVYLT